MVSGTDRLPIYVSENLRCFFSHQNLRLKLSDTEDVVCASDSQPEELVGQQVEIGGNFVPTVREFILQSGSRP